MYPPQKMELSLLTNLYPGLSWYPELMKMVFHYFSVIIFWLKILIKDLFFVNSWQAINSMRTGVFFLTRSTDLTQCMCSINDYHTDTWMNISLGSSPLVWMGELLPAIRCPRLGPGTFHNRFAWRSIIQRRKSRKKAASRNDFIK